MSKPVIKEIRILHNDAYSATAKATGLAYDVIERRIFNRMIAENILYGYDDKEAAGKSVSDIFIGNGYTVEEMINILFNDCRNVSEVPEFLNGVMFWGVDNDCPNCGCEVKVVDYDYTDDGQPTEITKCTNSECEHRDEKISDYEAPAHPDTITGKYGPVKR